MLSISAAQMQKDWTAKEMFVSSEVGLILHPQHLPVKLWQEEIEMDDILVSFALRV